MIRKLFSLIDRTSRRELRGLLIASVVSAVLQGGVFLAMVPFLSALFSGDNSQLTQWFWILGLLGVLYAVTFWIGTKFAVRSTLSVSTSLLNRFGALLAELPLGWFAPARAGAAVGIATEGVLAVSNVPYLVLRPILTAFITPSTVLIGLLFLNWRIAVVLLLAIPIMATVYRWVAIRSGRADLVDSAAAAAESARIIEYVLAQPALRAAGDNAIARELVDQALERKHESTRNALFTGSAGVSLFGTVVQFAVIGVIALSTSLALHGQLSIPALMAVMVLAVRFTEPIVEAAAFRTAVAAANNILDQFRSLLREEVLPEPATSAPHQGWEVRFDNVDFSYGDQPPVLRNLSFTAPEGAITAIVGPSGSGKTTITRLIMRFYDPQQGVITIGGTPLQELGSDEAFAAVAPVFQDVYLFSGSIMENIWLGNPTATPDQVLDAGALARVDEIAQRLPEGWETHVGEGGARLSGGERQRVSIARALLKNAPIFVLDEATAALDIGNEEAVHDAFTSIRRGHTTIVVAHRLQTIAAADHIVMLDGNGGVAEQGGHEELLARSGMYARYWAERVESQRWRLATGAPGSPSPAS
ncbi:ABC transporter ATP-binding protein [Mycobacteroides abscessus]|uniref:ABC transporter ATP-binding protein n=1 Tax=Mycobacteroides abscessus TaxID=36809 RepID=UPI000D3EAB82|nr:ABC transporter ATP-binding protein [Mycobacteroides abscessus]PVB33055.1 ABC transporter [Mycobacteroides abscessus]